MKITFQPQPTSNTCMSTCIAMILDQDVHDIMELIHEDYRAVKSSDEEFTLLHTFLSTYGIEATRCPEELDEGLYIVVLVNDANHHACLLSIYKNELKLIDPLMFTRDIWNGFCDTGSIEPSSFYGILKVSWDQYQNFHGGRK